MYFGNLSAFGHVCDFCVIAIELALGSELCFTFGSVLWCVDLFARGCHVETLSMFGEDFVHVSGRTRRSRVRSAFGHVDENPHGTKIGL